MAAAAETRRNQLAGDGVTSVVQFTIRATSIPIGNGHEVATDRRVLLYYPMDGRDGHACNCASAGPAVSGKRLGIGSVLTQDVFDHMKQTVRLAWLFQHHVGTGNALAGSELPTDGNNGQIRGRVVGAQAA